MVNLEDFIISKEAIERINEEEHLLELLEEGTPLQEIFGFSNETTTEFYETAKNILEQKRFEEAMYAFIFLTSINPNISDFWLGLGMAQQKNDDHDAAFFSYTMGLSLEGNKIFPYVLAAQCCIETKKFEKALEVFEKAESYADEHSEDRECEQLKKDASAGKAYVLQQKRKG